MEQSKSLNEKLGYVSNIRSVQFISLNVQRTNSGKKSTIVFVDLPDNEKIQTNIIDYQKLYEQVLVNNAMTCLADLLIGFQNGTYNLKNAPYEKSKMTQILSILLSASNSSRLNLAFLGCIWPTEQAFHDVNESLQFI
jgi:hypothetical protein